MVGVQALIKCMHTSAQLESNREKDRSSGVARGMNVGSYAPSQYTGASLKM